MQQQDTKISVLGDGGWGTTLALLLAQKGHAVTLWGAFPEYVKEMAKKRENRKFLPGFRIGRGVSFSIDIHDACAASDVIVLAVPSQYMRSVLSRLKKGNWRDKVFVSVAKGLELGTLKVMSQVVRDELGRARLCVLSGPTIAREVAQGRPAAVSLASSDKKAMTAIRKIFESEHFRLFETTDVLGVELGGSLKNVIAISAGIVQGLGLGSNTCAALFARGVAEIARLGHRMGARRETFMGLSCLGDLTTTCISPHSRNRSLGEQIGRGKPLSKILNSTEMVVEGVETARSAYQLAKKQRVSMPITEAVYGILFKRQNPHRAVKALMQSTSFKESD